MPERCRNKMRRPSRLNRDCRHEPPQTVRRNGLDAGQLAQALRLFPHPVAPVFDAALGREDQGVVRFAIAAGEQVGL